MKKVKKKTPSLSSKFRRLKKDYAELEEDFSGILTEKDAYKSVVHKLLKENIECCEKGSSLKPTYLIKELTNAIMESKNIYPRL